MFRVKPQGSIVAVVTPMRADGAVDYAALARLVEWHLREGTQGFVAVGTTGESPTLDFDEHLSVVAAVVRAAAGRTPVIAGSGANSTKEAILLARRARDVGADCGLSVAPYYNKPTQEGLYRHFAEVAAACPDFPTILYNVPKRTVTDIAVETVVRLAALPPIVGIKDATGEMERIEKTRAALAVSRPDFAHLTGDDSSAREFLLRGGDGVISVTANVAPAAMRRMIDAARGGDGEQAAAIDADLAAFHRAQGAQSNPIPVKWALARMGMIDNNLRLPLTPLTAECHDAVAAALARAGIEIEAARALSDSA